MNDKPTYKELSPRSLKNKPTFIEYAFSHRSQYVRSLDGQRYYLVEDEPKPRRFSFFFAAWFLYLVVLAVSELLLKQPLWHNLQLDFFFAGMVVPGLLRYRWYRHVSFRKISDDEDHFNEARKLGFNRYESRFWAVAYVLIAALLLLHSLSFFGLRSAIEHSEAVRVIVSIDGYDVLEDGSRPEDEMEERSGNAYGYAAFFITIYRTPFRASFNLDGQPLTEGLERFGFMHMSWFFANDYLEQSYGLDIPIVKIHDGSVLEMTCGEMHRTWVFDLTEEDAS